jgi:hypothetical protein
MVFNIAPAPALRPIARRNSRRASISSFLVFQVLAPGTTRFDPAAVGEFHF